MNVNYEEMHSETREWCEQVFREFAVEHPELSACIFLEVVK